MRENRTYSSEGGEGLVPFPTPIGFGPAQLLYQSSGRMMIGGGTGCQSEHEIT